MIHVVTDKTNHQKSMAFKCIRIKPSMYLKIWMEYLVWLACNKNCVFGKTVNQNRGQANNNNNGYLLYCHLNLFFKIT